MHTQDRRENNQEISPKMSMLAHTILVEMTRIYVAVEDFGEGKVRFAHFPFPKILII